jgi:CRP-like cAMP-binding protein
MQSDRIASAENQLLARLPRQSYQDLLPHLRQVFLPRDQILYKAQGQIEYAYFPIKCALSALNIMENGSAIEVATVGYEGMVGQCVVLGIDYSPHEVLVQIAGNALRIEIDLLKKDRRTEGPFHHLMQIYSAAFHAQISQSVACNGLHTVPKRCCRWLLDTQDRVQDNSFPLTHEYLAYMLGVRRSTVSETLQLLEEQGLIRGSRGAITVIDRQGLEAASCECYRRVKDEFARLFGSYEKHNSAAR